MSSRDDRREVVLKGGPGKRYRLVSEGDIVGWYDTLDEMVKARNVDRDLRKELEGGVRYAYFDRREEIAAARLKHLMREERGK